MEKKFKDKDLYDKYISFTYSQTKQDNEDNYHKEYLFMKNTYGDIFNNLKRDITILDLGCGFGRFAYFCKKEKFSNYIGIDIGMENIKLCRERFNDYILIKANFFDYLENIKDNSIDIIHMSHVFEHLTLEEGIQLAKLIYKKLKKGGIWLNIMPNADSYFFATSSRYIDITHKIIYNYISFNEVLQLAQFNIKNINHRNWGYISFTKYLIHKMFLKLFEIIITILGYNKSKYYTTSLVSIIKK